MELELFRCLQMTFKEILEKILKHIDDYIAEHRDKKRFELKEKRAILKALNQYDAQRLLSDLNRAVGTMANDEQEADLEQLICFLEAHREALIDYRKWLQEQSTHKNLTQSKV